jgi:membrane protease YdiL (CAAX protease family)
MRQAAVPEIVRISMIDFFKLMTCKIIIKHLLVFICQLAIKSAVKWERSRIFFFLLSKVVIGTSVVIPESVEFILLKYIFRKLFNSYDRWLAVFISRIYSLCRCNCGGCSCCDCC